MAASLTVRVIGPRVSEDCASRKLDPCSKHGASSVFLRVPEVSNPFSQFL
jgi:hypothetical protein